MAKNKKTKFIVQRTHRRRYQKQVQHERDHVLDQLRSRLKKMRIRMPKRPLDEHGKCVDPMLPYDITQITDEELGRIHGAFALMAQYVKFQVSLRAVEHAIARRAENSIRARVRLEKDGTVADKAAQVEVDVRTRDVSLEALIGESEERLTEAILDGYLIGRDASSREIARRKELMR